MKHKPWFTVIILLTLLTGTAHAQQAKAYELVKYTAKQKGILVTLNYADGYIGASIIKLKEAKTIRLFSPESGTPDTDGSLRFVADGNTGLFIVLKNIDETVIAPSKLIAEYHSKSRVQQLLFIRKK